MLRSSLRSAVCVSSCLHTDGYPYRLAIMAATPADLPSWGILAFLKCVGAKRSHNPPFKLCSSLSDVYTRPTSSCDTTLSCNSRLQWSTPGRNAVSACQRALFASRCVSQLARSWHGTAFVSIHPDLCSRMFKHGEKSSTALRLSCYCACCVHWMPGPISYFGPLEFCNGNTEVKTFRRLCS